MLVEGISLCRGESGDYRGKRLCTKNPLGCFEVAAEHGGAGP